jgi:murein L,D-transpeptidase YcbB/YkuD
VTISAEQRRTGAKVDGIDGPDTTRHLQARLNGVIGAGLNVDGVRGPLTIKALQTALNGGKF